MNTTKQHSYFLGGGEMAERTRNHDWASTTLGPIEQWPQSLRNTVAMVLSSKFPMLLWWGPDHIQFYNDAYRPSMGDDGKHPKALGQNGEKCWPEIWNTINPLMDKVLNEGESVWREDLYLPIYRNGKLDDVYWTFSYSPVMDENNVVQGVLVICDETTEKVLTIKSLTESKKELEFAIEATELGTFDLNPLTGLFTGNARLKEWFGLRPDEHIPLGHATSVIALKDRSRVEEAIAYSLQYESGGLYDTEYTIVHPVTKTERIVRAKGRAQFNENKIAYRLNGTLQDITEGVTSKREIAKANELNDLILKNAGVGLFRIDLLTGQIQYNKAFSAILTGDPDKTEISRKSFAKHIHPDDVADRDAALIEGAKTNEFYYSPRMIWDDGSVHRVHVMGTNTLDETGKPIVFSGTVRDITILEDQRAALETAETLKREGDAMFRNVTDTSPVGLWLSDENGEIIYVNRIFSEWTGLSQQEFMQSGWANSIVEEDRERLLVELKKAVSERVHYDTIFRQQNIDKVVWCRVAGDPYYNEDGSFAGYSGYVLDINEIIESRKALMQSEERFRSMIEQAPVATCLFAGKEMLVEVANDIMIGYWGKDKSVMGKPLSVGVPELVGQPFLDILDKVYTTGIAHSDTSTPVLLEVGGVLGTYYFDFTYQPLFDTKGEVYGVMDMAIDVTERVLAQQRVAESQKQILDSFEQSPVGIAILAKENLVFTMANPFYGELVGRDRDSLIGKPLMEILPELDGQGFDKLLDEVIATGVPFTAKEISVNLKRNNRLETIYVDLTYQPMYDSNKNVTGVLVVATDVTQQVQSRIQVEQSEAKLRSIIATAPAGIGLFVGRELIVDMPNQTFIDIVGKGWDIVGKPLREAMPELIEHGQPFLKILDDVFTTGKMYQSYGDQVIIVQNGITTYNYYNITYTPLFNENNEVYAILDIAIDVTEAIEARQRAEDIGGALRGAIELAELATWRYNIKDDTFTFSQRFLDWLGFTGDDTVSVEETYDTLPADYVEQVYDAIAIATGKNSSGKYDKEHPIINRRTGQIRIIHSQAEVTYDSAGNPEFLTGNARDITKERRLQQELEYQVEQRTEELQEANIELADAINALEQNNEELQQFAYIASHDLQEPTRKISIFAKMLADSLSGIDERPKMFLDKISTSAERMAALISDILAYSQLSKDNNLIEPVDLNQIAAETITDFELIIEQSDAVVNYNKLPVVEGIPRQMSQLFGNLISNSLKYRRPNVSPIVSVTAEFLPEEEAIKINGFTKGRDYYRITFSDNGIGFNQEYADKIFNIFQRLHGKSEYSGTGIGLSICKKIVLNHHGTIEAKGSKDEGATFVVILPAKQNFDEESEQ